MGSKRKRPAKEEDSKEEYAKEEYAKEEYAKEEYAKEQSLFYYINNEGKVVLLNQVGPVAQKGDHSRNEANDSSRSGIGLMMSQANEQVRQAFQNNAAGDIAHADGRLRVGSARVHLTERNFALGLGGLLHQHYDLHSENSLSSGTAAEGIRPPSSSPHTTNSTREALATGVLCRQTSDWRNSAGNDLTPTSMYQQNAGLVKGKPIRKESRSVGLPHQYRSESAIQPFSQNPVEQSSAIHPRRTFDTSSRLHTLSPQDSYRNTQPCKDNGATKSQQNKPDRVATQSCNNNEMELNLYNIKNFMSQDSTQPRKKQRRGSQPANRTYGNAVDRSNLVSGSAETNAVDEGIDDVDIPLPHQFDNDYYMIMYSRWSAEDATSATEPNGISPSMLHSNSAFVDPALFEVSGDNPVELATVKTEQPFHYRTCLQQPLTAPGDNAPGFSSFPLEDIKDAVVSEFGSEFDEYVEETYNNVEYAGEGLTLGANAGDLCSPMNHGQFKLGNSNGESIAIDTVPLRAQRSDTHMGNTYSMDDGDSHDEAGQRLYQPASSSDTVDAGREATRFPAQERNATRTSHRDLNIDGRPTNSPQVFQPEQNVDNVSKGPVFEELQPISAAIEKEGCGNRVVGWNKPGEADERRFAQSERQVFDEPYAMSVESLHSGHNTYNDNLAFREYATDTKSDFMKTKQDPERLGDIADFRRYIAVSENMAKLGEIRQDQDGLVTPNIAVDVVMKLGDVENIQYADEKPADLMFPAVLGLGDYGPNDASLKKKILSLHQKQGEEKCDMEALQKMLQRATEVALTTYSFATSSAPPVQLATPSQSPVYSQDSDPQQESTDDAAAPIISGISPQPPPVQQKQRELDVWRDEYVFLMSKEQFDKENELISHENLRHEEEERILNERFVKPMIDPNYGNEDWQKSDGDMMSLDESYEDWNASENSRFSKTTDKKHDEDAMLSIAKSHKIHMTGENQLELSHSLAQQNNRDTPEQTTNHVTNAWEQDSSSASDSIVFSTHSHLPFHERQRRQPQELDTSLYMTPEALEVEDDSDSPDDTPIPLNLPASTKRLDRHTLSISFHSKKLVQSGLSDLEQVTKRHQKFASVKIVADFQQDFGSSVIGKVSGDVHTDLVELVKLSIDPNTYSHLKYD
ncbi:hypothetical protein BP6252_12287 [Coleophoma cylindrospora]|uniref:Uncharacterized protein n=1 Tax=Coleophoma cylindrospora TaxID=1849047 RepID=A0A3D8QHK9_9HELO|nr:hypothetical protein BP6252_12287 [Coleophoma cylindrospora]